MNKHNSLIRKRMLTRQLVMQALYQWSLSDARIDQIKHDYIGEAEFSRADADYFHRLLDHCETRKQEIDAAAEQAVGYPFSQVDPVEKALIRSAISEMMSFPETNRTVVISEAVRLAKKFGSSNGYRFVNAVLDEVRQKINPHQQSEPNDE